MCCSSQSYPGRKLVRLLVCGLLFHSVIFSGQLCLAAESSSLLPVVPQAVQWVSGPVDAVLAGVAEIHVPAGFRFTDAKGARILLESSRTPVPKGLAGLLTPVNGDWWITFEYSDSGHVATTDQNRLDQEAVLKAFYLQTDRERHGQGLPALSHSNWEMQPSYHAARQYVDYAVRMESPSSPDQIAYVARFLGRRGVLQAKAVRPWRDGDDATVFRDVLKGVAFKTGERYADFQKTDKMASGALSELITAEKDTFSASGSSVANAGQGMNVLWIVLLAIGAIATTGIVIIAKKLRHQKLPDSTTPPPAPLAAAVAPVVTQRQPAVNGSKAFKLNVRPKLVVKPVNGNGNGHSNRNGNGPRGKRMFNYQKFYTEMVLQGPAPTIAEPVNGYGSQNGHDAENSHGNQANGNGNHSSDSSASVHAHSELIASQKSLIEEQKRLIHEQARLIEEKSKLIAEKNHLLDRQSQMIDNNLL